MSSPSALDTAFRTVVMLGVLGGGAWAAAKYTPIVEVAAQQWKAYQHRNESHARDTAGDAPAYQSPASASVPVTAQADTRTSTAADAPAWPAPPGILPNSGAMEPIRSSTESADFGGQGAQRVPVSTDSFAAQQAGFQRPAAGGAMPGPGVAVASGTESMAEVDAQLGRLGAQYTVLERWGQDAAHYRFHCRVALAGTSGEVRRFEAEGEDPLRLMRQVLQEVTQWRVSRGL